MNTSNTIAILPTHAPLNVRAELRGKHILVTGVTGFVAKVWLAHLLTDVAEIGHVYVLIRHSRSGGDAHKRFRRIAERSPCFRPLRAAHGQDLGAFLDRRVTVLQGDIGEPLCGLDHQTLDDLAPRLDALLHVAGLTDFNPDPAEALAINVDGASHIADIADHCQRAVLLHTSTCFVAGNRSGRVAESITPGLSPNGTEFDPDAERDALASLCAAQGQSGPSKAACRARIKAAEARALRLGWPNIYTYSKGLSEHLLAQRNTKKVIVRPAIVECATGFPFPGWNEGINTSGPLVWLLKTPFRHFPSKDSVHFDVIPVDQCVRSMTVILAAAIRGDAASLYQLGSSQTNPLTVGRALELTNLAIRKHYSRPEASRSDRFFKRFLDAVSVEAGADHFFAMPRLRRYAKNTSGFLSKVEPKSILPPQLKHLAKRVAFGRDTALMFLDQADKGLGRLERMLDMFRPFIHDNDWVFVNDNIRSLHQAVIQDGPGDFAWTLDALDWRQYWFDVMYPGLEQWCLPLFDGDKPKEDPAFSLYPPRPAGDPRVAASPATSAAPADAQLSPRGACTAPAATYASA